MDPWPKRLGGLYPFNTGMRVAKKRPIGSTDWLHHPKIMATRRINKGMMRVSKKRKTVPRSDDFFAMMRIEEGTGTGTESLLLKVRKVSTTVATKWQLD